MHAAPLALTMGEPAGIGAEIALRAWQELRGEGPIFVALDDPGRLTRAATAAGLDVPLAVLDDPRQAGAAFARALPVLPVPLARPETPGRIDPANPRATLASIERAVDLVGTGAARALVTNPIQKSALYAAGFEHPGHTEFLGALSGTSHPVMMLACPELRVVPVTIHLRLADALAGLRTAAIVATGRIAAAALRADFAIPRPRLAVAGVNPHAGEDGALGPEDAAIVKPAIDALRAEGIDASGPMPPDSMFAPRARGGYDLALCMYHDQALIPLKTLDVDGGVNVTLGLPFVRTSPDHGTGLDIAGAGRAHPGSLIAALRLADEIARNRSHSGARP
ncbi:MAG: 4-hydroxythreonine-4-phosphate dehydrogenase PdxA [Tagaea sp.]